MSIKILTVDDSKTIRQIIAKAFRLYDCNVLEAANGVVGLAVASRDKPDVILLDYTMPVMDGFEVLARLRGDPDLKGTPVIMLTAEAGRETVVRIAKLGVRDYLIKPFKEELLIERVRRVVPLKLKTETVERPKRFDDPIKVLVVDDKPAIVDLIRAGLASTAWQVTSADQPGQALDHCMEKGVDVVLVSLSLPKDGAYMLFQNLRGFSNTASVPVFGLCVKTATADQARAQQVGLAGFVTKPIDCDELKVKIARALRLETTYKYFNQADGALRLIFPKAFASADAQEISAHLNEQLTAIVEAGGDKLIVDLSEVEKATLPVIELVLVAIEATSHLAIRHVFIGSETLKRECQGYEESQSWVFVANYAEALTLLQKKPEIQVIE